MNQKTTYEVTITSKLEQLPIPDLREAIWSRIEGELDADMPTDDGGDTPPSSPNGGRLLRFALPGLVVILLTTFFLIKANKTSQPATNRNITPVTQTVTPSSTASPPPVDTKTLIQNDQAPVVYPGTNVPVPVAGSSSTDSAFTPLTDIIPPITDNTNQQAAPLVQAPTPQPLKTDSVAKKKRGVSGITDNDYRITPVKRDSTKG